ncbi:hypothetical protein [Leucobacter chromiiresistens]|uniref:Uncharacterized protein n=1 Tax=Leucobacter chromiiresistens TaxID=1079994 RepID=A0A1H0Y3J2_9MICO|nr:hypothetical protein [Leucobacter chromiiresistens]SDQ09739.1 hypothetical protein SAMN04488565_0487 [Leucobacter chromiiresistens]
MIIDRFRLPIVGDPPPLKPESRSPTVRILGACAVGILGGVLSIALIVGGQLTPKLLFMGTVYGVIAYFCWGRVMMAVWPSKRTMYLPGSVSYEQQSGRLRMRTPLAAKTTFVAFWALGLIGSGASSTVALCWSVAEATGWEKSWIRMGLVSLFLPLGIGILISTFWRVRTTCGVSLAPTSICGQAEGMRLEEVPWESLRAASVGETPATKFTPLFTSLRLTTDRGAFHASSAALGSDPHSVRCVIEFFQQHPEHRNALEDPRAALELVRNAMLSGWRGTEAAA